MLSTILRSLPTLDQLYVLRQADLLFADRCGRYYQGPISAEEMAKLLPEKR